MLAVNGSDEVEWSGVEWAMEQVAAVAAGRRNVDPTRAVETAAEERGERRSGAELSCAELGSAIRSDPSGAAPIRASAVVPIALLC